MQVALKSPRGQTKRAQQAPRDPAFSVMRGKAQVCLSRDLLSALGQPSHVLWLGEVKEGKLHLVVAAANAQVDGSYKISYLSNRPNAMATFPGMFREALQAGRYVAADWAGKTKVAKDIPKTAKFEIQLTRVN